MSKRPTYFVRLAYCGVAFAAAQVLAAAPAQAGYLSLVPDAGYYSVLYAGTGNLSITNVVIDGNIGVGGSGHVHFSGGSTIWSVPATIGGALDFSASNTNQFSSTNSTNIGPTAVNYNVAKVTTALNQIGTLSSTIGAEAGTNIAINGPATINASAGTLDANGNEVFHVTSYSMTDGHSLTINGNGHPVVFNFSLNSNVNLGGDILLEGGLTPDQVLWNFTSSNKNIGLNNNASSYMDLFFQGIILAPNDKISLTNANFKGAVWGGAGGDMQIVSGTQISPVPLPGALLLFGSGLTGLAGFGAARHRKAV